MTTEINFQDLPETIVLKIFIFVAEERIFNLFKLRRVCKKWCRLSEDASLWRKLIFPNCDNLCYEVLERILNWCGDVKEVNLSNCGRVDDKCIELITEQCPNLKILDLSGCRSLSDTGLDIISKMCRLLSCLSITVYKTNVTPSILKDMICVCTSLQEIRITCESDVDSNEAYFYLTKELLNAVQMSPNLKKVIFSTPELLKKKWNWEKAGLICLN